MNHQFGNLVVVFGAREPGRVLGEEEEDETSQEEEESEEENHSFEPDN